MLDMSGKLDFMVFCPQSWPSVPFYHRLPHLVIWLLELSNDPSAWYKAHETKTQWSLPRLLNMRDHWFLYLKVKSCLSLVYRSYCHTSFTVHGGLPSLEIMIWRKGALALSSRPRHWLFRYCKAVEAASKVGKSGTSLLSRPFLNSLEDLQERLTGEPSTKPANLIGGRKAGKPGVNKLGSWIEGRLTKFIAGEEDTEGPIKATPPTKGKESSGAPVGPFSHFSTISPAPSNPVTRAASTADVPNGQYGGRLSPAPQGSGHQPTSSSSSSIYGEQYGAGGGYGGYNPYSGQEGGEENGENEDTPHALEPAGDSGEVELLNPMAALSLGPTRQATNDYGPAKTRPVEEEEDEDDLGFGNTSLSRARTPKPAEGGEDKGKKKDTAPAKAATPEPAAGGKSESLYKWE
jgi:hypothetical protein